MPNVSVRQQQAGEHHAGERKRNGRRSRDRRRTLAARGGSRRVRVHRRRTRVGRRLGSGPNPYDLLATALAACTAMTVRLYAERKKFPVAHVRVAVSHHREGLGAKDMFDVKVHLAGPLDDDPKEPRSWRSRVVVPSTSLWRKDPTYHSRQARHRSTTEPPPAGTLSDHAEDIDKASMDSIETCRRQDRKITT